MGVLSRWLLFSLLAFLSHQANAFNIGYPEMRPAAVGLGVQHQLAPRGYYPGGDAMPNVGPLYGYDSSVNTNQGVVPGGWFPRGKRPTCPPSLPYCTTTKAPVTKPTCPPNCKPKPTCPPNVPTCSPPKPTCPPNVPTCSPPKPTCPPDKVGCPTPPPQNPKQWQFYSQYGPHQHHYQQGFSNYYGGAADGSSNPYYGAPSDPSSGGAHVSWNPDALGTPVQDPGDSDTPASKPQQRPRWLPRRRPRPNKPLGQYYKWPRVLPWKHRY